MFFNYDQNNSGGSFIEDHASGISHFVIVEADSAVEANEIAKSAGVYFDEYNYETGEYSYDCECCGARWSEAWDGGTAEPSVYGREIVDGKIAPVDNGYSWSSMKWMSGPEGYIHYKDGRVEPFDY